MKKKIIGIFVCMLLIATAVSAVESYKNSAINPTVPSTPLTNLAGDWTQILRLLAEDGQAYDNFGSSVSFDRNYALIGAFNDDDNGLSSGSVYVFTRDVYNHWTQTAKLMPTDGAENDLFGYSVSLSGDTALIGALQDDDNGENSGSAYVFIHAKGVWTESAKLHPSPGAAGDQFGRSVSLSGDTALIGSPGDSSFKGAAYVFTYNSGWTLLKKIPDPGVTTDWFGISVSLDGDTALIGADSADGFKGAAYVFTGPTWTQTAKLPSPGGVNDNFGFSVSLDGDTALIGAFGTSDLTGAAYVFTDTGTPLGSLFAIDGGTGDGFGMSVSLDGDTAFIGAPWDDDKGEDSGSMYAFTSPPWGNPAQQKLLGAPTTAGDNFGWSVSLNGNTAFIGAFNDDDMGINSGSAFVFTKIGLTITKTDNLNETECVHQCDYINYTICSSTGIYDQHNVVITDPLPDEESFVDASPGYSISGRTVTWNMGTVENQSTVCVWELVLVRPETANGTIIHNEAFVTSSENSLAYAVENTTVCGGCCFNVSLTGGFGYKVNITNICNQTATNVPWNVTIDGKLVFFGKHKAGTIASLPPFSTTKIGGLVLGFGKITITVIVDDCPPFKWSAFLTLIIIKDIQPIDSLNYEYCGCG